MVHRAVALMRLHILARGRIGRGPEAELLARYAVRLPNLTVTELGERELFPPSPERGVTVVLDERGPALASVQLAQRLRAWRDDGVREARFLIGAADGHDPQTRAAADLLLSFGPATWPHLLVRAMLAEQLYRAETILGGHPYHRV